nr:rhodanese-like domain-containing protein [uncultured Pseudodesulfovibrio sp.]
MIQRKMLLMTLAFMLGFVCLVESVPSASAGDNIPRMGVEQLAEMIDFDGLMIIDVRRGRDWDKSEFMIKNAVRKPHDDTSWIANVPQGKTVVLYCA